MESHVTMSSKSAVVPDPIERLTKMRSAVPFGGNDPVFGFGCGFCASSVLCPPVAALPPFDQITAGAFVVSVAAGDVHAGVAAIAPVPLLQTTSNVEPASPAGVASRIPFVFVKGFVTALIV